jgi:RimJ/RimL family protein N-acetyltransferase
MIDSFETDRLTAERLEARHFDEFCKMYRDPTVMATLGGVRSEEQIRENLAWNLAHWERHGFGLWVFRDKAEGRFVGRAGLRHTHVGGRDEVELAYALMAEFWGRGLATEMARAILRIGFEEFGLKEIVCFTMTTNRASQRVMEKAGFVYERDIVRAGLPHVLYRAMSQGGGNWKPTAR